MRWEDLMEEEVAKHQRAHFHTSQVTPAPIPVSARGKKRIILSH